MEEKFSRHTCSSNISTQGATSKTSLLFTSLVEEMLMDLCPLLRAAHPTTKLVPFQLRGDQVPLRYFLAARQPPVHGASSHECPGEHAPLRSPDGVLR